MSKVKIQIEDKEIEITPKQKLFCETYVSNEFFANGVQSYMEAFKVDETRQGAYNTSRAKASQLLTNGNILLYINSLLELSGLNEAFADKQLTLLMTQNADFGSKLGAIREYNKLRQRIEEKVTQDIKISFK